MCTVANHIPYLFPPLVLKRLLVQGYFLHLFEIQFQQCCSVAAGCTWLIPRKFRDKMFSIICATILAFLWRFRYCLGVWSTGEDCCLPIWDGQIRPCDPFLKVTEHIPSSFPFLYCQIWMERAEDFRLDKVKHVHN